MVDEIYVLVGDGYTWEDMIIVTNTEDAIKLSVKHPRARVEIFTPHEELHGYTATYRYYIKGVLCE